MTIEEAIDSAAKALNVGASEKIIALLLMEEGFSPEKVKIILRWAKQQKAS